jgi:UDP-glucose 4-epimerase
MSSPPKVDRRLLVTGSAGFIGSRLLRQLEGERRYKLQGMDRLPHGGDYRADIRDTAELRRIAQEFRPEIVVHLAALREVTTPWSEVGDLFSINVLGTYSVLDTLRPRLALFASTSSVYGDGLPPRTAPLWDRIGPKSAYGISKASGELTCDMWARETGNSAVVFRMGNLVGTVHGLLHYLLDHARTFPAGSEPARLRGAGVLVRDYIPLQHVLRCFSAAVARDWEPGCHTINVASGIGITNREIFEIVRNELKSLAYEINAVWSSSAAPYEAEAVVLEPSSMEERLGIAPPGRDEVIAAIRHEIREAMPSRTVMSAPIAADSTLVVERFASSKEES